MDVSSNIRALHIAVDATREEAIAGRNRVLRNYHSTISPGVAENLTYTHGSQVYKDKTLNKFLKLIEPKSLTRPIQFIGGDDNNLLARAANDVSNMVYAKARGVRDTGTHISSIQMLFREVGSLQYAVTSGKVYGHQLPERTVVAIVATAEYASTLEKFGRASGFLYAAALEARAKYGSSLVVRYDYVPADTFGAPHEYALPRIQLAHYGNLKAKFTKPAIGKRRRDAGRAATRSRRRST